MNQFAQRTFETASIIFSNSRLAKFLNKQKGQTNSPAPSPANKSNSDFIATHLNMAAVRQCRFELPMNDVLPEPVTPSVEVVCAKEEPVIEASPRRMMADAFDQKKSLPFFERKYAAITDVIPFNPSWSEESETFKHLLTDIEVVQEVLPGQQVKCCDDLGRRMIITGTALGAVVIYQRFAENSNVIYYNARDVLKSFNFIQSHNGEMTEQQLEYMLGSCEEENTNIGDLVQNLVVELQLNQA